MRLDFSTVLQNDGESGGSGVSGGTYRDFAEKTDDWEKRAAQERDRDELMSYTRTWVKSLSEDEKKSVRYYTYKGDKVMNGALRDGDTTPDIKNIDNAISTYSLANNMVVHRVDDGRTFGLDGLTAGQINGIKGNSVGTRQYVSTTIDSPLLGFSGNYIYNIKIPKGKGRGAYIDSLSEFEESEFLIKRGANFRIDGASVGHRQYVGRTIVDLTMLR